MLHRSADCIRSQQSYEINLYVSFYRYRYFWAGVPLPGEIHHEIRSHENTRHQRYSAIETSGTRQERKEHLGTSSPSFHRFPVVELARPFLFVHVVRLRVWRGIVFLFEKLRKVQCRMGQLLLLRSDIRPGVFARPKRGLQGLEAGKFNFRPGRAFKNNRFRVC